jgi:hypothetical protein
MLLLLHYNCQTAESKRADAIAIIFHHGHCIQENGDTSEKKEAICVLWSNKTKCLKRVQRRNLEWIHLLCHPSMHFANSSVKQAVFVNGEFPLLQNVLMKLEYELDVYRIRNSANIGHL